MTREEGTRLLGVLGLALLLTPTWRLTGAEYEENADVMNALLHGRLPQYSDPRRQPPDHQDRIDAALKLRSALIDKKKGKK